MLTPIDRTLAAQSATRWVVSLAAWMPLSVNCTKLMYVGMTLLLQVIPESVSAERPSSAAGSRGRDAEARETAHRVAGPVQHVVRPLTPLLTAATVPRSAAPTPARPPVRGRARTLCGSRRPLPRRRPARKSSAAP